MTDWPDWRGKAVAIVASGPSTKKADVEALKGRLPVLAIKKNVEIAPFADVVYGCDHHWWRSVHGLPNFKGLKLSYDPKDYADQGVRKVDIRLTENGKACDRLIFDRIGEVGAGGNSGFQALNLAAQWGADRILLIGFDCQDRSGPHWYGRNTWVGGSTPSESNFRRWRAAFCQAAEDLKARGVIVHNASPLTDVRAFPKIGVADSLKQWGLT